MLPHYQVKRLFAFAVFTGYGLFGGTAFVLFFLHKLTDLQLAIICSPYAVIAGVASLLFTNIIVQGRESSIYHFNEDALREFTRSLDDELNHQLAPTRNLYYYYIRRVEYHAAVRHVRRAFSSQKACVTPADAQLILDEEFINVFCLHKGTILTEEELYHYLHKVATWLRNQRAYMAEEKLPCWKSWVVILSGVAYPVTGFTLMLIVALELTPITDSELASATGLISAMFASYWSSIVNGFLGLK
jgi:hypothetical protein